MNLKQTVLMKSWKNSVWKSMNSNTHRLEKNQERMKIKGKKYTLHQNSKNNCFHQKVSLSSIDAPSRKDIYTHIFVNRKFVQLFIKSQITLLSKMKNKYRN